MQRTSDLVRDAIAHVRDTHPYWNASGGADHFMVFSYDHGKCEMAKALQFEEFGKMFSVQAYGSLVYRCSFKQALHLQCLKSDQPGQASATRLWIMTQVLVMAEGFML